MFSVRAHISSGKLGPMLLAVAVLVPGSCGRCADVVIDWYQTFQTIAGWGHGRGVLGGTEGACSMLAPAIADPVNYQYLDYLADDLGLTGTRTWEVKGSERVKQSCQAGELGAGLAAIARQGRHRRWPASSKQANEALHSDVRLPQNGPQRAPVRFWRALSSAQDRATGWLVASALPARCQPVAPVMLRRSYDGVTKELRRGYEGNQPKNGC